MSDERIVFVGTIPSIQSAIQISGDGSGRIKIDTPQSELSEVIRLLLLKDRALRFVVVEEKGQPDDEQEQSDPAPAHKKSQAGDRWSSLAHLLHTRRYFHAPPLWEAMDKVKAYTQAMHKNWIEKQPCWFMAHSGAAQIACSGPAQESGRLPSIGHHVRTAANSGTGIKPDDWYLLPTCNAHHQFCHGKGVTREFREMLLNAAVQLTADQMKSAIKRHLQLESLSGATKETILAFEESIGYDSHFSFGDAR